MCNPAQAPPFHANQKAEDGTKANQVPCEPSLDATRSAYEQGGTPGDKTGPELCSVKMISLN